MRLASAPLCLLLASCAAAPAAPAAPDLTAADDLSAALDLAAAEDARTPADLTALCGEPSCQPGAQCQTARGCCSCGPFARACLPGWTCAEPAGNDARCPKAPPAQLSACELPADVSCWYCAAGAPLLARCTAAMFWSECQQTGAARCWGRAGPTRGCD